MTEPVEELILDVTKQLDLKLAFLLTIFQNFWEV